MALAKVYSAALVGLDAQPIEVEADLSAGLFCFSIVGLPDKAISEAKERVSSALKNSGFSPPQQGRRRVIVNLAPADLKKAGPAYDLAIALAYLFASSQLYIDNPEENLFVGELSLEGKVRPISGILSIVLMAKREKFQRVFLPKDNAKEAGLAAGRELEIMPVGSLSQLALFFKKQENILPVGPLAIKRAGNIKNSLIDMAHIKGQEQAKRALEIAASGGHNVLMHGPPGAGKTLLARGFSSILPPLSASESMEVTRIFSVVGSLTKERPFITERPVRTPHHTASAVSLVGGGSSPKPGEITLAHRGVLFLDEIPEFNRYVLESLRQPLEDGVITVSRASSAVTFPAKFILIAAMNPCPCGKLNDPEKECACTASQISKYKRKLSAPLLDRIDLHIEVPRVTYAKLSDKKVAESSETIRERVKRARDIQEKRFKKEKIMTNSEMDLKQINKYCQIGKESQLLLKQAVSQMHLSARSYYRLLKISRTITDLIGGESIQPAHIAEAIQYRSRQEE